MTTCPLWPFPIWPSQQPTLYVQPRHEARSAAVLYACVSPVTNTSLRHHRNTSRSFVLIKSISHCVQSLKKSDIFSTFHTFTEYINYYNKMRYSLSHDHWHVCTLWPALFSSHHFTSVGEISVGYMLGGVMWWQGRGTSCFQTGWVGPGIFRSLGLPVFIHSTGPA